MELVPFSPKRFTDSQLFTAEIDGEVYLVKSYLGSDAEERCELERMRLSHWKRHAFRVPEFLENGIAPLSEPHLIIKFIPGVNLSDVLKDAAITYSEKYAQLEGVYAENARRHLLALEHNDKLLVHTDPNTDNILLVGDSFVTIDFEHPAKDKPILQAIAHEVLTFTRRVLTDLGREHLPGITELVVQCYAERLEILENACELTLGRSFQFYHRYKDKKKKAKKPGLVTRYDLVDSLRANLLRRR